MVFIGDVSSDTPGFASQYNDLQARIIQILTTAERDAESWIEGQVIYNTTDAQTQVYNGASWDVIGGGGGDALHAQVFGN